MVNEHPTETESPPGDAPEVGTAAPKQTAQPVDLRPSARRAPTRAVPTNRIAFVKQLDMLRAYAAASGLERRAVSVNTLAQLVQMAPATASLANAFFVEAGLVARTDAGFVPSQAVFDYQQAFDWDASSAGLKLAPPLRTSWPWVAIEPHVKFRPLSESEAVRLLAEASSASKEYEPQLRLILSYFEVAGLIERDGSTLRLSRTTGATITPPADPATPPRDDQDPPPKDDDSRNRGGGSNTPPPPIHPALIGLLQLLPPPLTPWRKGKQAWVKAFTAALDTVYPGDDEDEESLSE